MKTLETICLNMRKINGLSISHFNIDGDGDGDIDSYLTYDAITQVKVENEMQKQNDEQQNVSENNQKNLNESCNFSFNYNNKMLSDEHVKIFNKSDTLKILNDEDKIKFASCMIELN